MWSLNLFEAVIFQDLQIGLRLIAQHKIDAWRAGEVWGGFHGEWLRIVYGFLR
jgi:hypothetical protein